MPCEIRRGAKGEVILPLLLYVQSYAEEDKSSLLDLPIFKIQKILLKISKFEKNFDKFSDKLLAKLKVICYNIIKQNSGFFTINSKDSLSS